MGGISGTDGMWEVLVGLLLGDVIGTGVTLEVLVRLVGHVIYYWKY